MKILIVDDCARRYQKLIDALSLLGIERKDIDVETATNPAIDNLEKTNYDLLILDLLIPKWPEDEADVQHSINLLTEIRESTDLIKPSQILGITADKSISEEAVTSIEAWAWQVIEYSDTNSEWINRVINCVTYLQNKENNSSNTTPDVCVDLAILCALNKPELSEILALPWNWSAAKPIDDNTFIHEGYFEVAGKTITVNACHASRMGMVSTALRSSTIINLLKPRILAMTGICAGIKGKTNYGDVIFAETVWDYQTGKHTRNNDSATFAIAPHQLSSSTTVRSHIEQLVNLNQEFADMASNYPGEMNIIPKLHIGPIATGSAVIADTDYIKGIIDQNRKVLGIEMEIYGLFAAVENSAEPKPKVFALKSVCDHGDENKGDEYQRFAAYTSANVLKLLMEKYADRLLK